LMRVSTSSVRRGLRRGGTGGVARSRLQVVQSGMFIGQGVGIPGVLT
jgi:hypothetical protein